MASPWEIFLESCKGPREAPAPEVPPRSATIESPLGKKVSTRKVRTKAAPKAPAKQ